MNLTPTQSLQAMYARRRMNREYTAHMVKWRNLRNHLQTIACTIDINTTEYKNICKRIAWINKNRL